MNWEMVQKKQTSLNFKKMKGLITGQSQNKYIS